MPKALILAAFFACCCYAVKAQYSIKIVIDSMPSTHTGDTLYIAGDFNSWAPNDPNTEFAKDAKTGKWVLTVPNAPANVYMVKVTRGATEKTECGSDGKDIPSRKLDLISDTTLYLKIAGWQDDFAKPKGGTAISGKAPTAPGSTPSGSGSTPSGPGSTPSAPAVSGPLTTTGMVYLNRKVAPSSAR